MKSILLKDDHWLVVKLAFTWGGRRCTMNCNLFISVGKKQCAFFGSKIEFGKKCLKIVFEKILVILISFVYCIKSHVSFWVRYNLFQIIATCVLQCNYHCVNGTCSRTAYSLITELSLLFREIEINWSVERLYE